MIEQWSKPHVPMVCCWVCGHLHAAPECKKSPGVVSGSQNRNGLESGGIKKVAIGNGPPIGATLYCPNFGSGCRWSTEVEDKALALERQAAHKTSCNQAESKGAT